MYIGIADSAEPDWQRITDPAWKFDAVTYRGKKVFFRFGHRLVGAELAD